MFIFVDQPKFDKNRKETPRSVSFSILLIGLVAFLHASEAVAAVNGTVGLGLKGNPSLATASSTGRGEVLTGTTSGVLASVAAGLAALGLILEAALCVELLLTGGENKLSAALFAYQCLVFEHVTSSL